MGKDVAPSGESWAATRAAAERARSAAHRSSTPAAGSYGRPLHPLVATVAIGMLVATFAFDVASITIEGRSFGRAASWLCAMGAVAGIVAAALGALDRLRIAPATPARRTANLHLVAMAGVILLSVVGFFLRRADESQYLDGTPMPAFVLSCVVVVLLIAGALLGSKLTYSYGVRVVDEKDQLVGYLPAAGAGSSTTRED